MPCARWAARLSLAGMIALGSACRTDDRSPPADTTGSPQISQVDLQQRFAEQLQLRRKAHLDALRRSVPEAERAFGLADPVAAFERGQGALAPAPHTPLGLAAARQARREAFKEIEEIEVDLLEPAPAVQLRAIAFGLERIEDAASGHSPTRTDPTVGIAEAGRVLDVVDHERAHGRTEGLAEVLPRVGTGLRIDLDDLGAASAETMAAALEDLEQLRARVERLGAVEPSLQAAAQALAGEVSALHQRLGQQQAALPEPSDLSWSTWPTPAQGKPTLRRLPAALGKQPLTSRLEVEEGLDRPFVEAVPQLLQLAKYLDGVDAKFGLPSRGEAEPPPPTPPSPVDAARCEPVVQRVRALVTEGEPPPELRCQWLLARWDDRPLSDPALTLAVIDDGLVRPQARERRANAPEWIALLSGRTAPHAHTLAQGLAIAIKLGDPAAVTAAVQRTRDAMCSTTTAVWTHGQLDQPERLETWLRAECSTHPPAEWIADVLARPRAAFDGLALTLVGTGPAGATMLDLVPWAPLGLVPPIAKPRRPSRGTDGTMKVVPLEGLGAAPEAPPTP